MISAILVCSCQLSLTKSGNRDSRSFYKPLAGHCHDPLWAALIRLDPPKMPRRSCYFSLSTPVCSPGWRRSFSATKKSIRYYSKHSVPGPKRWPFVEKVLMLSQNINKAFTTTYATSIHMKVKLAPVVCEPGTENHYYTLVNKLEMHPVMLNGWLKALQ